MSIVRTNRMTSEASRKSANVLFRLTGRGLACYVLPLPIFAFLTCVYLSVKYNFEESTYTHCEVENYLPSISAAIGGFTPQRYIWRICIALHCAPRFLVAIVYFNHFRMFQVSCCRWLYYTLAGLNSLLHVFENLALVSLSYISSTENYRLHEASFVSFMVFSQIFMVLTCILFKWSRSGQPMCPRDKKSMRYKLGLLAFNLFSAGAAVYFFIRHNQDCEPGAYSMFALGEYLIVASNIGFHGANIIIDFGDLDIVGTQSPYVPYHYRTYPI